MYMKFLILSRCRKKIRAKYAYVGLNENRSIDCNLTNREIVTDKP